MKLEEQKISQKTLYEGKVITVWLCDAKLPNGHISLREVVHHSGGAAVLFVKDNKILLERQFRFPYNKVIWEIPAGKLNKGEDPLDAAKRELEEETGFRAENLRHLIDIYPSPGYTDEIIYIYLADGADMVGSHLDEDEFINAQFIDISEVERMIDSGEINDAKTVAAVYKYLRSINQKQI